MPKAKKVLVLGASGAMGRYIMPLLAEAGHEIDAVSLWGDPVTGPNVRDIRMDAMDRDALRKLLKNHYDGIVNFMIYNTAQISLFLPLLLDSTEHHIFLSSYRVYDDKEVPIRETSPRIIDATDNVLLRDSDNYCIYKARGENVLAASGKKNWTIVRPAITYSLLRYQLVTLEGANTVGRAFAGKKTVLPVQAKEVAATMSWGGDVAAMIAKLLFNDRARGETYTVSTAEHHTWGEIAEYYHDICGLEAVWVDKEDYLRIIQPDPYTPANRWQLEYDRLFTRIMDNSKVLAATGMKQSELMPLYDGLKREIARCPRDYPFDVCERMDDYLAEKL